MVPIPPVLVAALTAGLEEHDFDEGPSGHAKIDIVVETDEILAFHHMRPFWPVHIVVVPKHHVRSLTDFSDESDEI